LINYVIVVLELWAFIINGLDKIIWTKGIVGIRGNKTLKPKKIMLSKTWFRFQKYRVYKDLKKSSPSLSKLKSERLLSLIKRIVGNKTLFILRGVKNLK
jgi:hypothetical protein